MLAVKNYCKLTSQWNPNARNFVDKITKLRFKGKVLNSNNTNIITIIVLSRKVKTDEKGGNNWCRKMRSFSDLVLLIQGS